MARKPKQAEQIPGPELVRRVRAEIGPRVILSFSMGKDSIGAYLAIRDHFDEVIPYYLYLIPGLEFVQESIGYFERALGRHIVQLPHPSLYRLLNNFVYQPLDRVALIQAANLPNFDYLDIRRIILDRYKLPASVLVASGVRAADSPMRRLAFSTHGAISRRQHQFYPVWDMGKAELVDMIARSGLRLPVDYDMFGRSFDGIDLRFLVPLRKHRPRDYARILEWFPLADLTIWRLEKEGKL